MDNLLGVPAEMSLGMLRSTAIECAQAYQRQEGLVEMCRRQKEGWGECGPRVEWGRDLGVTGHGKVSDTAFLPDLPVYYLDWAF